MKSSDINILVADIPVTEQLRRPPKPVRPSVPIPTDEEAIPEDLTIASTELDLSEIPPPPVPPSEEDELAIFVAYTEAPEIIGGSRELFKYLKYPLLAEKAGVEGTVFVNVLVGVSGKTEGTKILKAKPANMGFEESAIEAIKKVRWKPAKQRDKTIRVWVTVPVRFKMIG